jgi:hypothetical protein
VVLLPYKEGPEPMDLWGELAPSSKLEVEASPLCAAF